MVSSRAQAESGAISVRTCRLVRLVLILRAAMGRRKRAASRNKRRRGKFFMAGEGLEITGRCGVERPGPDADETVEVDRGIVAGTESTTDEVREEPPWIYDDTAVDGPHGDVAVVEEREDETAGLCGCEAFYFRVDDGIKGVWFGGREYPAHDRAGHNPGGGGIEGYNQEEILGRKLRVGERLTGFELPFESREEGE